MIATEFGPIRASESLDSGLPEVQIVAVGQLPAVEHFTPSAQRASCTGALAPRSVPSSRSGTMDVRPVRSQGATQPYPP